MLVGLPASGKSTKSKEFAEKYNLNLEVNEKVSTTVDPGIVIWQSRRSGSVIAEGVSFEVNISKAPEVVEEPSDEPSTEEGDTTEDTTTKTPNTSGTTE